MSTVSCANEFASNYPKRVLFVVDDELASSIRKVAANVKENNLLLEGYTEYGCVWSEAGERDLFEVTDAEGFPNWYVIDRDYTGTRYA